MVPWKLGGPRSVEYSTSLFNRSLEVGDVGVKLVGLIWLATALAFLAVAVLLWRRHAWALRLTIALLAVSLGLCIAGLPGSIMGLCDRRRPSCDPGGGAGEARATAEHRGQAGRTVTALRRGALPARPSAPRPST